MLLRVSLINCLKGLQAIVTDNLGRAVRDNDLIYLDPIPTLANLPVMTPASMVKPTVPPAVTKPLDSLHDGLNGLGRPVFETLVPYAVHQAISVYSDRVESFIRSELASRIDELDALAASTLQSLNLPGAIQVGLSLTRRQSLTRSCRHSRHPSVFHLLSFARRGKCAPRLGSPDYAACCSMFNVSRPRIRAFSTKRTNSSKLRRLKMARPSRSTAISGNDRRAQTLGDSYERERRAMPRRSPKLGTAIPSFVASLASGKVGS